GRRAQGERLRVRQALFLVAEDEGDTERRFRRRRLYARQRLARPVRRATPRLLGWRQAVLRLACRFGIRRRDARASEEAARAAAPRRLPVCRQAGTAQSNGVGRAE